jgi:hypothetical protein
VIRRLFGPDHSTRYWRAADIADRSSEIFAADRGRYQPEPV